MGANGIACALLCSEVETLIDTIFTSDEEARLVGMEHRYAVMANPASTEDYRAIHDVALGGLMIGFMAPLRPMCVRTLKAPKFSDSPCQFPGCKIRGCTGNSLYWVKLANGEWGLNYR